MVDFLINYPPLKTLKQEPRSNGVFVLWDSG